MTTICAEGYLFELERRGHLQAGAFVPEVILDNPDALRQLHLEFVNAGSDVTLALTYYAHREKMRAIGKEDLLEPINRQALEIASEIARGTGTLLAGNICNTNIYEPGQERGIREMFDEQLQWAVEADVDAIVAETFSWGQEGVAAVEAAHATGKKVIATLAIHGSGRTREGWTPAEGCARLAAAGADVVGLNCIRGPDTMLPLVHDLAAAVDVPLAALPVPYRTTDVEPTMQTLEGGNAFPDQLDPHTATRQEVAAFTQAATAAGVSWVGLCCGAGPHHVRAMAEALGRRPVASRYTADMTRHAFRGEGALAINREFARSQQRRA